MKKIIVTEDQAKRLKFINEDINPITKFEELCNNMEAEVNKIYAKVINTSIAEIINNEVDMHNLYDMCNSIENKIMDANRVAYAFIETQPEADLDLRVDNADDKVNHKLSAIQMIILDLERLQSTNEEHKLGSSFNDVKPIDITSVQ